MISCTTSIECGQGDTVSIAIELNIEGTTKPIQNVHLYGFSASGKFNIHEYFTSKPELDAYRLSILRDGYTVVSVVNVGEDFVPLEGTGSPVEAGDLSTLTLTDLIVWLKGIEGQYPDIMTGMGRDPIDHNGILTIFINLKDGSDISLSILRLHLNLLDHELPDYNTRNETHHVRAVAEVYKKGTVTRIHSHSAILTDSVLDLYVEPGEYDILLWADHTPIGSSADHHYSTTSLREVQLHPQNSYTAGVNSRKSFAKKLQVVVPDQPLVVKHADMPLTLAKYQIIATDVERYKDFIRANDYPALDNLEVTVSYAGFLPSSYDVHKGEPNSSSRTVRYTTSLSNITDSLATIGGDYIFANDVNSSVSVSISVAEKNTRAKVGRVITRVSNIKIDHIRGHLTTIKFGYLTAGIVDSGVSIDDRWEGVIDVYF